MAKSTAGNTGTIATKSTSGAIANPFADTPLKPIESGMGGFGPSIQHPHVQSPIFAKQLAAFKAQFPKLNRTPGKDTPCFVDGDNIVFFSPLEFIMTPAYNHYIGLLDNKGKTVKTFDVGVNVKEEGNNKPAEIIDSVVLVEIDGAIRPAQMRLKRAECTILRLAYESLSGMDPADKKYAKFVKQGLPAFMYMTHTVEYEKTEAKKQGGMPYFTPKVTSEVTSEEFMAKYTAAMKTEEFQQQLADAVNRHDSLKNVTDGLRASQ